MAIKKTAATAEMIDVVDKDDKVLGQMDRDEALAKGKRFRIAHVLLIHEDGTLLLQWRKSSKTLSPRMFTASAAGTVLAGESYEDAAVRELEEEVGAKKVKLTRVGKFKTDMANGELFVGNWSGEPKGWEAEADAIDYLNREEASYLMQRYPYLISPSLMKSLKLFLKETGDAG